MKIQNTIYIRKRVFRPDATEESALISDPRAHNARTPLTCRIGPPRTPKMAYTCHCEHVALGTPSTISYNRLRYSTSYKGPLSIFAPESPSNKT